mgnify:CR=1 FL=1
MTERYYLDSSIWMDLYEDRKGYNNEPLGDYAWRLLSLIRAKKARIIITDLLIKELGGYYSPEQINGMMVLFEKLLDRIIIQNEEYEEGYKISSIRNIPLGDAIHAIVARNYNLILITRDKHFIRLKDISAFLRPEEI